MDRVMTKKLIELDEGNVNTAYPDSESFLTIGVGRCIDNRVPGAGLSPEEIEYLFDNNIVKIEWELMRLDWFRRLSDMRQAVIMSMAFQLGISGLLKFKLMIGHIKAGYFNTAADEMLDSKWARQTPDRAKRLAWMMRNDKWSDILI